MDTKGPSPGVLHQNSPLARRSHRKFDRYLSNLSFSVGGVRRSMTDVPFPLSMCSRPLVPDVEL